MAEQSWAVSPSEMWKGEVQYEQHIGEQTRGEKMENNEPDKSQQMLQRKCLQPNNFVSTPALETALTDYIAYSNQTAKPIN
jgi:hypothetical protein